MKHGKHIQVSESFLLCALLTMTGGFLDVYTYITRGHVFANAQTGNVVLLGLNLAEGNIKEVAFYLFPIIAFALGILFTEWIRAKFKEYDLLHWRQIVVFFEALLLFFPAFMASGMLTADTPRIGGFSLLKFARQHTQHFKIFDISALEHIRAARGAFHNVLDRIIPQGLLNRMHEIKRNPTQHPEKQGTDGADKQVLPS